MIPVNAVGVCIIFQSSDDPNFEHAHEYIEQNMDKLATLRAARAAAVAKEGIWVETQVISSTDSNEVTSCTQGFVQPGSIDHSSLSTRKDSESGVITCSR